jgi:hypothetical protein
VPLAGGTPAALTPPAQGFDQPLAWDAAGDALAVRSFTGTSAANPGTETAVVVSTDGQRRPVTASGDILVFGWVTGV